MIAVFSGPPCSGKSLVGEIVASALGITHLEMDAIRVRLLPNAAHTREDRVVAYRAMHLAAELLAARGHDVIVNAGYSHMTDRREIEDASLRSGVPLYLVEFTVSPEAAVARSRARRTSHPGADLTDQRVAHLVANFPYFRGGLLIDGSLAPGVNVARVLDYLSSSRGLTPGLWPPAGQ